KAVTERRARERFLDLSTCEEKTMTLAELQQKRARLATEMRTYHDAQGDADWGDETALEVGRHAGRYQKAG
ncbi:hypothetical protein ACFOEY_19575, partial [Paracandidimonas soli]|uniref:hypothetical protein n=1 Tax=Paracandidimonas soli TaxID=1917182 RepID=UPI00360C029B